MSLLSVAGFTNLGYLAHSRGYDPISIDMTGKTVVISGATSGLGLAAAREIADLGATVAVIGRSPDKLARAGAELGARAVTFRADLSLLADVRRLGDELIDRLPRIDVLINNVGVLLPEKKVTDEGLDAVLVTNLAGQFLLTNTLVASLAASAPSRVIIVTSGGMYAVRIAPDRLDVPAEHYRGAMAYAQTKRAQVILTEMWADGLAQSGVVVHAMHPGWAKTGGVKAGLPTFDKLMKPLLRTAEQGADTIVWLAASDEPGRVTGQLWFDRQVAPTHLRESTRETADERQRLWERLVDLTGSDLVVPALGDTP